MSKVIAYLNAHREYFLDKLFEFLRIPSISTQSAHTPDVFCAALAPAVAWGVDFGRRVDQHRRSSACFRSDPDTHRKTYGSDLWPLQRTAVRS